MEKTIYMNVTCIKKLYSIKILQNKITQQVLLIGEISAINGPVRRTKGNVYRSKGTFSPTAVSRMLSNMRATKTVAISSRLDLLKASRRHFQPPVDSSSDWKVMSSSSSDAKAIVSYRPL